jgi:hypothetical protein
MSKNYKPGDHEVRTCKATGLPVIMEYTGHESEDEGVNGHKGWLCLHNESSMLDAVQVDAFNAANK